MVIVTRWHCMGYNFFDLRPSRGQTFGLLAVALTYLQDPENAQAAYEQALVLDAKDPAVALNYAIFMFNQGNMTEAIAKLQVFEARVYSLRDIGLDADPDIVNTALNLCKELDYDMKGKEHCMRCLNILCKLPEFLQWTQFQSRNPQLLLRSVPGSGHLQQRW